MFSLRANLALALTVAIAACPVFAASAHRKAASHHAATAGHSPAAHTGSTAKSGGKAHRGAADTTAVKSATGTRGSRNSRRNAVKPSRLHGQQAIQPERVTEIQQALIREHYLSKEADGRWDAETEAAMQKYQADQGWQTKLMPDSRAIKKLGLGPDYSNAINAKSANFGGAGGAGTTPAEQASGFAAASGINR